VSHGVRPRIAGVRVSMLAHLYRARLRSHWVQELLAASGIAVGVALVLGVLVANTSLTSSAGALIDQLVGSARLQLVARSADGFAQRLQTSSERLPGVQVAAPVLRENIAVVGPRGRDAVQLLGVTHRITSLEGIGDRELEPRVLAGERGLVLPTSVAAATGVHAGEMVTVLARGMTHEARVAAVLDSTFGALDSSPVAITRLALAQRLTELDGRITQVLIQPHSGEDARVAAELRVLAAGRLDVVPANNDLRLLEQAAKPNNQSTSLFAAISVMVGFLLAVNAMLLTVPERRRFVADLRMQGYDWRQILALLGFQALTLGVVASAGGVLLGDLLSHAFFHRIPAYLTTAFPIGSQETLHTSTIVLALACGVLATALASVSPVLDLLPSRPTDAVFRDRSGANEILATRTALWLSLAGVCAIALITVLVLSNPSLTIFGGVALALATLCVIPLLFSAVSTALRWTGERVRSSALIVVVSELRAITTRSVALAGIAALAIYGSVAIGGARADLLRGLNVNFDEYLRTADIWVTTGGNDLTTNSFVADGSAAAIEQVPGVLAVHSYQGGFLDDGPRRLWIIARPSSDIPLIPASQLLHGNLARATRLIRGGGWVAVSGDFATEHDLRVGGSVSLPTPTGAARLGVAAIVTNLGWAPGAIILNTSDYSHYWQTDEPSALEVDLRAGVSATSARRAVQRALARGGALSAQTFQERRAQYQNDSRQGLQALSEIALLLLLSAALAVASALSAALWQRRARLASLKIQGYGTGQLWRALLLESAIVLSVGCIVGAIAGAYGHALAVRWMRATTGFPAPFSIDPYVVVVALGLVALVSLAVIALPGLGAARAPARASLQE
jgi:putative ABC transport system permease protein